jgi:hypothetical protein
MTMIEFDFGGHQYRAEKLNAFQQFHVSRKIAPLIPAMIPVFLSIEKMKGGFKDNLAQLSALLQPIADGIAALPDESAEYVISTCLAVVRRKAVDNWTPVWSGSAKAMMFDDINDLGSIMPLVMRVIQDNLGPFISGFLTSQAPAEA